MKPFEYKQAINYSGYRQNQSPRDKTYPTKGEILEDLLRLQGEFYYLRIYDCSTHAYRVLELIEEHNLHFKVMLGLSLYAEINHDDHPYFHKFSEPELQRHTKKNAHLVEEIIELALKYKDIVNAISIGNEIRSPWSNRRVSVQRMVDITLHIQTETNIPVTYCEEYHTWISDLKPLAEAVDFISIHTYPAWQGKHIDDALDTMIQNYQEAQEAFPTKPILITETGWPTSSHGHKIKAEYANVENQKTYNSQASQWAKENQILVYLFEAFDEPWKGGDDPLEPEKNWGIYYVDRTRK